jgi:hypothetical protein
MPAGVRNIPTAMDSPATAAVADANPKRRGKEPSAGCNCEIFSKV